MTTLSVAVCHRLGALSLDAAFESSGRLTALFGPSGSGKTSLVNIIAGLIRPDQGFVRVDGTTLVDTKSGAFLPKHRRRIGYVFQDARLFPHMTVRQNLAYGRWFVPRGERYADERRMVELLGIGDLLDRRPGRLSGGEKQRVAIGRALIASPRLILMDEPLASLDEQRKAEILPYIERLRDETKMPIVYVSHAIAEVARLATDVVLLAAGKVAAAGPTAEILQRLDLLPADEVGEGGALLEMAVDRHDEKFGMTVLSSAAGEITVPKIEAPVGAPVRLRIRARDVMVATEAPRGLSALNVLAGRIAGMNTDGGPLVDVRIDCNGEAVLARLTRQSTHTLGLALGQEVFAVVKTVSFERGSATRSVRVDA
jgi:molybdate transport system ATP-binding protein